MSHRLSCSSYSDVNARIAHRRTIMLLNIMQLIVNLFCVRLPSTILSPPASEKNPPATTAHLRSQLCKHRIDARRPVRAVLSPLLSTPTDMLHMTPQPYLDPAHSPVFRLTTDEHTAGARRRNIIHGRRVLVRDPRPGRAVCRVWTSRPVLRGTSQRAMRVRVFKTHNVCIDVFVPDISTVCVRHFRLSFSTRDLERCTWLPLRHLERSLRGTIAPPLGGYPDIGIESLCAPGHSTRLVTSCD